MRLICPECNALYDIPGEMIPPEGREVECSACGRVWLETPEATPEPHSDPQPAPEPAPAKSHTMRGLSEDLRAAARAAAEPAPELGAAPVLQRELPDDVLSVLREETARELGARRAARGEAAQDTAIPVHAAPETMPEPPAPTSIMTAVATEIPVDPPADQPIGDWPATTVTAPDPERVPDPGPIVDSAPHRPPVSPEPAPPAKPVVADPEPAKERPPVPGRRVARGLPDVEKLAATLQIDQPALVPEPAIKAPPQSGYRAGLRRALTVTAALLVAYILASAWVGTGNAPGPVASLVAGVDAARISLQDAASALLGGE